MVDGGRAGQDVVAVAAGGRPGADDEVPVEARPLVGFEVVVGVGVLVDDLVSGHVPRSLRGGAQQRQAAHRVGSPCGDAPREVRAVRVAEQQHRSGAEVFEEVAQPQHHVVVAVQVLGRRQPHPRQVGVDPPVPRGDDGLDRRLDLAVVDARSVQRDQGNAGAVLDVVNRHVLDLITGTRNRDR